MSGTSLDGIDLAEITLSLSEKEGWSFTIIVTETVAYSSEMKLQLQEAISYSEEKMNIFNEIYTSYLAKVISNFIKKNSLKNIDAVCSHGHTILHKPDQGITLQIGNLPKLATLIQQKVVCDFRMQDVEMGGQGAPLVPIGDQLLFKEYDYCLNLGGFANVSFQYENKRIAYDICAVNIVLNYLAEKLGFEYDEGGNLARKGEIILGMMNQLNNLSFYKDRPPKSLGLEWVKEFIFPVLDTSHASIHDKLRTLTEHMAYVLAKQFRIRSKVLVTGGGAYNTFLLRRINFYKELNLIVPTSINVEYKEALIFGLLGVLKLREEVNCLASVTGASRDHSSGIIFLP